MPCRESGCIWKTEDECQINKVLNMLFGTSVTRRMANCGQAVRHLKNKTVRNTEIACSQIVN